MTLVVHGAVGDVGRTKSAFYEGEKLLFNRQQKDSHWNLCHYHNHHHHRPPVELLFYAVALATLLFILAARGDQSIPDSQVRRDVFRELRINRKLYKFHHSMTSMAVCGSDVLFLAV